MEPVAEPLYERTIEIDARPETIWKLLTDPEKATRWMGQSASLDPRPGGEYRVTVLPGNTARGSFVEVDRPRRLVYTWGWEPNELEPNPLPPGTSTIEIELEPAGSGTILRFRHSGLPDQESAERHRLGWDHYLDRLAIASAGKDPGADPWLNGVA